MVSSVARPLSIRWIPGPGTWHVIRCKNLAISVSFGGDTKSRRSLPSGVYASRSKDPTHGVILCNLSWTPHSNLEKDNSLNHSCVSPKMGCLEYTYPVTKRVLRTIYRRKKNTQ